MKTFNTLQEYVDYVPTCLICKKEMRVSLTGTMQATPVSGQKRWASSRKSLDIKFDIKEGVLVSKHKTHKLSMKLDDNSLVEGEDIVARLTSKLTFVKKSCQTCHVKIQANCSNPQFKKEKRFPALTLHSEELHFTMRGGKDLNVTKYYGSNDSSETEKSASIQINYKYLPPVPFDFNKFNSFEQLTRRISTIVLFQ